MVDGTGARFTRRRESFHCLNCTATVHGDGYTNHCPHCLWSRHVDVRPGDRAADCGGLMEPVGALHEHGQDVVVQRCVRCGHTWRNRTSGRDDRAVVLALFGRVVTLPPPDRHHHRPPRPRRPRPPRRTRR